MKETILEKGLDIIEEICKIRIKGRYRNPAARVAYMNMLEMIQLAREENLENLELILEESK